MASIIGNFAKAKRFVDQPNSSLYLMTQVLHVPLPCEYLADVKGAMMLLLNEELKIFSAELQGVPVAFNKKSARLMEKSGSVISAQPFTHCNLQSEFVVFKPKLGDILNGVINKVTPSSFGCLVHNCFYATIHRGTDKGKSIPNTKVGSKIQLRVTKLEEDGNGVLSITGEICGRQPKQKKGDRNPPDTVNDSGIDNSDFAPDYTTTTSVQDLDKSVLNTTLKDPHPNAVLQNESLSSLSKTGQNSKSKIFSDPESINNASLTTCYTVDINAEKQSSCNEGTATTTSTSEDHGGGRKDKKKKLKKEKKHKKKRKKERKAKKKLKKNKMKIEEPETEDCPRVTIMPSEKVGDEDCPRVTNVPRGKGGNGQEEEKVKNISISDSPDVLVALNANDFFSPSSKKSAKIATGPSTSIVDQCQIKAKVKTEKKSPKKRKRGQSEAFSSPPEKRSAPENLATFAESTAEVIPENNSTMDMLSEHEQQALYHLHKLGINLPLSVLKSGMLSLPIKDPTVITGEPSMVESSAHNSEPSKKKSRKSRKILPHGSVSASNIKNESPHLENVSLFLKAKDTELLSPRKNDRFTVKKNKKPDGISKKADSVNGVDCACRSPAAEELDLSYEAVGIEKHNSKTSQLPVPVFSTGNSSNVAQSHKRKKEKNKKHKEKKRKKLEQINA